MRRQLNILRPFTITHHLFRLPVFRLTSRSTPLVLHYSTQILSIAQCQRLNKRKLKIIIRSRPYANIIRPYDKEAIKSLLLMFQPQTDCIKLILSPEQVLVRQLALPAQLTLKQLGIRIDAFIEALTQSLQTPLQFAYQIINKPNPTTNLWQIYAAKKQDIIMLKTILAEFNLQLNAVEVEQNILQCLLSHVQSSALIWLTPTLSWFLAEEPYIVQSFSHSAALNAQLEQWRQQRLTNEASPHFIITGAFQSWQKSEFWQQWSNCYQNISHLFNWQRLIDNGFDCSPLLAFSLLNSTKNQ